MDSSQKNLIELGFALKFDAAASKDAITQAQETVKTANQILTTWQEQTGKAAKLTSQKLTFTPEGMRRSETYDVGGNKINFSTEGNFQTFTKQSRNAKGQFGPNISTQQYVADPETVKVTTEQIDKQGDAVTSLTQRYAQLAIRAALVVPIWWAIRQVFTAISSAIGEIINDYKELDIGMAKVMAVATYTANTQKQVYADLEQRARQYFATSTASFRDITQAMYELGSAGRSTEEIAVGFKHIMDLASASYTDVTTIARTVAGILNVFDKELNKVGNTEQKIKYVADALTDAWRAHQVEVSEISQAFTYLGSVGAATGVTFKELLAATSVLGDSMLKGGKGGRLLASAIIDMGANTDKLQKLGVIFDPYKPIQFREIMGQLAEIFEKQGSSLYKSTTFIEIFGKEGSRAILDLLAHWEDFNKEIDKTPAKIDGTAQKLKELSQSSIWALLTKSWRNMLTGFDIGSGDSLLKDVLSKTIVDIDKIRDKISSVPDIINATFLNEFSMNMEEMIKLYNFLMTKGAKNLAQEVANLGKQEFGDTFTQKLSITGMYDRSNNILDVLLARKNALEDIKTLEKLIAEILNKKKVDEKATLTDEDKEKLKNLKDEVYYEQLKLDKVDASTSDYQKLVDFSEIWADKTKAHLTTQQMVTMLLNEDVQSLVDAGLGVNQIIEGMKKVYTIQKDINEEAAKYVDIIRTTVSDSLEKMMAGQSTFGGLMSNIKGAYVDTYRKTVAEGLSNIFISAGGADTFAGTFLSLKKGMGTISDRIEAAHETVYKWIVKGHEDGSKVAAGGTIPLAGVAGGGGINLSGGMSLPGGLGITLPGFGQGGWFSQPVGGMAGYNVNNVSWKNPTGSSAPARGQMASQSLLLGYSAYQSARAGGLSPGLSAVSGIGMGVGSLMFGAAFGTAAAGMGTSATVMGALGAMGPVGWIGLGLMAIGMAIGLFGGGKSTQRSSETKTTDNQVASRIDVTNKNLDIINRNLIALRTDIRSYILPTSAYFSEKNSIDDEFSLMSRRGYQG
jgi:TP901 family phage tail tape measure protein